MFGACASNQSLPLHRLMRWNSLSGFSSSGLRFHPGRTLRRRIDRPVSVLKAPVLPGDGRGTNLLFAKKRFAAIISPRTFIGRWSVERLRRLLSRFFQKRVLPLGGYWIDVCGLNLGFLGLELCWVAVGVGLGWGRRRRRRQKTAAGRPLSGAGRGRFGLCVRV